MRGSMYFVFQVLWLFLIFCFEPSGKASSIKSSSSSTHLHPSFTLSNPSRLPICASTKSIWGPIKNIYASTSEYLCTNHNVFVLLPKGICGSTKTCNCVPLKSGPVQSYSFLLFQNWPCIIQVSLLLPKNIIDQGRVQILFARLFPQMPPYPPKISTSKGGRGVMT